ncbi:MAG: hypothetical protein GTN99_01275, partial [Candidatus Dadabacteria bacterium]|nr:hypothetical protein [Candidatus Dadabacteria bacterium]
MISGSLPKQYLTTKQMYDVFDLCISCKACKSECPSAVDVAKMKIEFLAHYGSVHGLSYRDRVFGYIHELSRYGSHLPSLVNFFSDNAVFRWIS